MTYGNHDARRRMVEPLSIGPWRELYFQTRRLEI